MKNQEKQKSKESEGHSTFFPLFVGNKIYNLRKKYKKIPKYKNVCNLNFKTNPAIPVGLKISLSGCFITKGASIQN
jgi:hypothetical protein